MGLVEVDGLYDWPQGLRKPRLGDSNLSLSQVEGEESQLSLTSEVAFEWEIIGWGRVRKKTGVVGRGTKWVKSIVQKDNVPTDWVKLFNSAPGPKKKGKVRGSRLSGSCSLPQGELGACPVSEGLQHRARKELFLNWTATSIPLHLEALLGICQPDGVEGVFSDEWTSRIL